MVINWEEREYRVAKWVNDYSQCDVGIPTFKQN